MSIAAIKMYPEIYKNPKIVKKIIYNQAMIMEGDVDYLYVKSYPSKKLKWFMPKIDDKTWKVAGTLWEKTKAMKLK